MPLLRTLLIACALTAGPARPGEAALQPRPEGLTAKDGSRASLKTAATKWGEAAVLEYELADDGWANLAIPLGPRDDPAAGVTLLLAVDAPARLELKFTAADGGTFGRRLDLKPTQPRWRRATIYPEDAVYFWGGAKKELDRPISFELAVSGAAGRGALAIVAVNRTRSGPSSFQPRRNDAGADRATQPPLVEAHDDGPRLDPDRRLAGYGRRQRRDKQLTSEDPGVIAWLGAMQDAGSRERRLLPSTPGGDEGQTFNNALSAMAFARHGQRERMERVLDFYRDAAADRDNADPTRQAFYLRGEARGFYQRISLHGSSDAAAGHAFPGSDRWMGDMAWLLLAFRDHRQTFGGDRYAAVTQAIEDLLRQWYVDDPQGQGGYVRHGWRRGDQQLHESFGHHEGNIDCLAVFTLIGETEKAAAIRKWLDSELAGRRDLPLDLYTWRVLAEGGERAQLLDVPDFDLRYRKTVDFAGRTLTGPYTGAAPNVDNVWIEGLGHLACAYAAAGNYDRANFYANQLDAALVDQSIGGVACRSLPYAARAVGDFAWVKLDEGFTSTAAWYVLAKHHFNPLRLTTAGGRP